MFLSIILYPLLHSAMNFCLKICFQQDPNFCMSMGQRYRYQLKIEDNIIWGLNENWCEKHEE